MKHDFIIIHCSASPNGRPQTVQDIDRWHREVGFLRSPRFKNHFNPALTSIGYQFVITLDGTIHTGRGENEVGAHAVNYNAKSTGICLIGTDKFTFEQWLSLAELVGRLKREYGPGVTVVGHRQLPEVNKLCPGFDVSEWLTGAMRPLAGHTLT